MSNAQTRGWGNPDAPNYRRDHIVVVETCGLRVPVHKAVAVPFEDLIFQMGHHYDLDGYKDDWGYANRDIRGRPGVKSNHSWGLAIDLNATVNPLTRDPKARVEFKREVVDPILRRYKGLIVWGGDYKGERKDYMHFEFVGTPSEARALSSRIISEAKTPKERTVATLDNDDLKAIDKIVAKHVKTVLGNTGPKDEDGAHVSLADILRELRKA